MQTKVKDAGRDGTRCGGGAAGSGVGGGNGSTYGTHTLAVPDASPLDPSPKRLSSIGSMRQ